MTDPGSRIGGYEVTGKLGQGGMGEVWRARDAALERDVALKFLPADFASDPDRHARFEREAKVLAALNHPHIATLYSLEHAEGRHVLVMEYVDGEDLAQRLERGAIPLEEAIPIALQVAEALEAAHEKGIVHRDLKPANIKVRPDGTVKVLDFGLAKAWESDGEGNLSLSPTITAHQTRAGVILGTAAYMSPEQARGKPVDRRADIWAFGVVLFEMLSGRRLFEGEMVTDVLANVLKQEADWSLLPASTPEGVRRLLRRCLERQPAERMRDIGDLRWELAEIARTGGRGAAPAAAAAAAPATPRRSVLPWIAGAALGAVVVGGLFVTVLRPRAAAPRTVRSYLLPPDKTTFDFEASVGGPVLSPDGTKMVFAAREATGRAGLWVRPLGSLSGQPLGGTEGATFPFWSSDSRWVAFFVSGKLRKIDVTGGPPETLCDAPSGRGGSWSPAGVIVFAPDVFGGLQRVAAAGGAPEQVSKLDSARQQVSQRWPVFLPDGKHFIYWAGGPLNSGEVKTDGIYLGSLDAPTSTFLVATDSNALYSPPGYLVYLREQTLMAQPFDAKGLKLTGEAFPIAEQVGNPQNYRLGDFSASQEGTLVYQTGETGLTQLVWLDPNGRQVGTVGDPAAVDGFRLSPDGRFLVEQVSDARSKNVDLWLVDLERNVRTRFTFDAGVEIGPVWSPSGDRIAYTANAKGRLDLYVKNANGAGEGRLVFASDASKYASDWSPDGTNLAITLVDPHARTLADIWIVPMEGDHTPRPFLATSFNEANPVFSPDGRWLAYQSNESGRLEIYLTPFPGPGGKWQVSQNGGIQPLWRRGGGALFYRAPDGTLFEAGVVERGAALEVGTPKELVRTPVVGVSGNSRSYAVTPNGDRFLVLRPVETTATPLTLVTHWTEGIRR